MGFQWDARKNASNREKHGVSFEQACQIFEKPTLERRDERRAEERWVALGHDHHGTHFVVVYTWRDGDRRIISAWKAGSNDREAYRRAVGET